MDKAQLLEQVVISLMEDAEKTSASAQAARQESIDAPGAMQSHSDTTKSQQDWLAQALAASSAETREKIQRIQQLDFSPSHEEVREGSIVSLREEGRDQETYFLLSAGSGIKVSDGSRQIVVTTPSSPIGVAVLGKTAGDRCEVRAPRGVRHVAIEAVE
ncbi:MAG: GreA/GreB family elongation factor [bacterium]|nr:GreA/GreB family elongation factor [bacterium]